VYVYTHTHTHTHFILHMHLAAHFEEKMADDRSHAVNNVTGANSRKSAVYLTTT
jgi:hypothetical protein